jgi:hypothetical protein
MSDALSLLLCLYVVPRLQRVHLTAMYMILAQLDTIACFNEAYQIFEFF